MACLVGSWSKDPVKQVGCVLVDSDNRVVATGFNGPPIHVDSVKPDERLAITIHAEINALLTADRQVHTAYIWPVAPCSQCMAALAQAGIKRIVSRRLPSEKWHPQITIEISQQLNIDIILLDQP
jgi:dCMP deaminase